MNNSYPYNRRILYQDLLDANNREDSEAKRQIAAAMQEVKSRINQLTH